MLRRACWHFVMYSSQRENQHEAHCVAIAVLNGVLSGRAVFACIGRTDRWQNPRTRPCSVNRNVDLAGYYTLSPLASPQVDALVPRWRDPVHVQVVIKITCTRAMSFGDRRTLPEGLHGCKLDRHLHRVNCETTLFTNYAPLWKMVDRDRLKSINFAALRISIACRRRNCYGVLHLPCIFVHPEAIVGLFDSRVCGLQTPRLRAAYKLTWW